jgi:hypothetical protein
VEFLPDSGHAVPSESGETMSRRPRRNHTPAFKAKVALAARRSDCRPSGGWWHSWACARRHRRCAPCRQIKPMFVEPEKRLARAAQFRDLVEDERDRLLHTPVRDLPGRQLRPCRGRRPPPSARSRRGDATCRRAAEIVVNRLDLAPAECDQPVAHGVLPRAA